MVNPSCWFVPMSKPEVTDQKPFNTALVRKITSKGGSICTAWCVHNGMIHGAAKKIIPPTDVFLNPWNKLNNPPRKFWGGVKTPHGSSSQTGPDQQGQPLNVN